MMFSQLGKGDRQAPLDSSRSPSQDDQVLYLPHQLRDRASSHFCVERVIASHFRPLH
ncbi:MAG: hypothetical protein AAGD25_32010 [Cyanobacteria bacterium P01_F01_bin.150]